MGANGWNGYQKHFRRLGRAVIAPAAAANPVLNPVIDIGAGVADAAAAQLPPQSQMLGPGPGDVGPVITYLKGS